MSVYHFVAMFVVLSTISRFLLGTIKGVLPQVRRVLIVIHLGYSQVNQPKFWQCEDFLHLTADPHRSIQFSYGITAT